MMRIEQGMMEKYSITQNVILDKGLGKIQNFNAKWFKDIPFKIKDYFKGIFKYGLQVSLIFQFATLAWFLISTIVLISIGFPIKIDGYPFYIMIILSIIWSLITESFRYWKKTRFSNQIPSKRLDFVKLT